jgi:hypothetical protein
MAGIVTAAQRAGQKVVNTSSVLYNKILAEAVFNLRIVGFPTTGTPAVPAPITCTIRRGVDDTIVNTYGQLPANVLSSVYQPISFKSPAIPNYTLAVGDIVTLEFTGGDASNYLQVQTDTTSGFDGANGYAMDVINNVVSNLTTTDMAGGFWGTGQTGVQATRFYNLGKGGAQVGAFYISNGAATKVAEIPVNSSSTLIGRTVNEIDVFLAKRGNPTGQVLVYILENTTGLVTYGFGSLDASKIPDIGSGYQQFNFFNYNNVFVNDVNSYMVVEFSGGDLNNQVAVACDASNPIDASNTNAYMFSGSWNPTSANGVTYATDMCGSMWGAGNPPAVLPPGSGSTGTPYSVKGNAIEGFTSKFNATGNAWYMVGELLNDAQSILVGIQINEIDLSLARVGTPVGQIQIFIFQANGNTIGTSSVNVDVSTLPTTPTPSNVKFPIVWSTSTSTYTLQVGDRICVQWTGGNPSTELLGNYVIISTNSSDSFDGNHSVLVTFTATGVYPSGGQYGVWNGIGGQWAVVTGWDLAGTFYT